MPDDITGALKDLAKLSGSDRNAILRRLSPEERRLLAKYAAPVASVPTPMPARTPPERKPSLPPCSPWLAKRLTALLDEGPAAATTTTAGRDAVRLVIVNLTKQGAP